MARRIYIQVPRNDPLKEITDAIFRIIDKRHCRYYLLPTQNKTLNVFLVITRLDFSGELILSYENKIRYPESLDFIGKFKSPGEEQLLADLINKQNGPLSTNAVYNFILSKVQLHLKPLQMSGVKNQKLKQKLNKNKKAMEVYVQKTITPTVTYKADEDTKTELDHNDETGADIVRNITVEETITETLERDVTICGYFVPEMELLKIGVAVRNPEFDEFEADMGKNVALNKARKTPTFVTHLCEDTSCKWGERVENPELSLHDINKHQMIKTLLYTILNDMEKDFGKYVAAYRES